MVLTEPVSDLVRFIWPELVATVGEPAAGAIATLARRLPGAAFRLVGLEVPLGQSDPPVDFLLQLAPAVALGPLAGVLEDSVGAAVHRGGEEVHAVHQPSHEVHAARAVHGAGHEASASACLDAFGRLVGALADRADPLFGRVADGWLEYDLGSGDAARPSLFAAPLGRPAAAELAQVLGAGEWPRSALGAVLDRLHPDEIVQQLGVMHGRRAELRCVITSAARPDPGLGAVAGLAATGALDWPGDLAALEGAFHDYGRLASRGRSLAVGFDGRGRFNRMVGIELHLKTYSDAAELLGRLRRDGLADPATCDRVLRWHGETVDYDHAWTPSPFRSLIELTAERLVLAGIRRVHHVKLTCGPDGPLAAKAYLGCRPLLVRRRPPGAISRA